MPWSWCILPIAPCFNLAVNTVLLSSYAHSPLMRFPVSKGNPILHCWVLTYFCIRAFHCKILRSYLSGASLDHIKRVLITGFHGARREIEVAAHLADNSTRLEDFVIDPVTRGVNNTWLMLSPEGREMFLCMARENARKYLAGRVAQGARFGGFDVV